MIKGKQGIRGQAGLTLVELMVAIAISMLLVLGSLIFLRYMVTVADENRDKTLATLEVQYVGFWISEDVAQAQTIELGASQGFPLTMTWEDWGSSLSVTITYNVENMVEDEALWQLMRTREVKDGEAVLVDETTLVAEYLIPWSDAEQTGTTCYRMVYDVEYDTMKSVVIEVAARADRSEASSTYEIYPRAVVDWLPQDVDGHYIGPECPGPECPVS